MVPPRPVKISPEPESDGRLNDMTIQFIHDRFIRLLKPGFRQRPCWFFFAVIRGIILLFRDPLVEIDVFGTRLAIPLSHALPRYLKMFPYYASNLGRLAAVIKEKYAGLSVIDIGANIGDSAAAIRHGADAPVLCVEGNPFFLKVLKLNAGRFRRVSVAESYVGDANSSLLAEDRAANGTSRISPGGGREIKIRLLSGILGDHQDFRTAKLVKIDTDGFDCKIIRGSADFLTAARPAVFFEYDPLLLSRQDDDGLSVFDALRGLGYDSALVYDNLGHFMLSLRLSDLTLLKELHAHFFSYQGERFGDFCVFHSDDRDLFETAAKREAAYLEDDASQRSGRRV